MPSPLPRQPAPDLDVALAGGGNFRLTDQQPRHFTLVVFYRGLHCPICRTYLAQLDRAVQELEGLGVNVVAVSGDSEDNAQRSVDEWKLSHLAVGYGLTVDSMRQWGLYVSKGVKDPEPELFGEPGIYLIRPDHSVYMAALNSMPAAQPRIDDLVAAIKFFIDNDYPARGEA